MKKIKDILSTLNSLANNMRAIPLLGIRLILALGFYYPAMEKWNNMESTIMWFGNEEWGLGLPFRYPSEFVCLE